MFTMRTRAATAGDISDITRTMAKFATLFPRRTHIASAHEKTPRVTDDDDEGVRLSDATELTAQHAAAACESAPRPSIRCHRSAIKSRASVVGVLPSDGGSPSDGSRP